MKSKASSYREVFFVLVSINKETNRNFPFRSNRGVVLMFCPHVNQSRLERVDGMASRECKMCDRQQAWKKYSTRLYRKKMLRMEIFHEGRSPLFFSKRNQSTFDNNEIHSTIKSKRNWPNKLGCSEIGQVFGEILPYLYSVMYFRRRDDVVVWQHRLNDYDHQFRLFFREDSYLHV